MLRGSYYYGEPPSSVVRRASSVVRLLTFSLNDFFSETTGGIWFKFGHKHYWDKGFQICTIEGATPPMRVKRGPKRVFLGQFSKIFSSEITGPISK